ncbi:MAG TPA: hypothetical protein VIW73_13250 [Candidatus Cybelea sp.]
MLDLGGFGGTFGTPNWINDRGEVVGFSNGPGDNSQYPFLWRNGKLINLGTFGGCCGYAQWINEAGVTVGWALESDNATVHAAVWKDTSIKDLGTLPGDPCAFAYGINSRNQIVGTAFATSGLCFWPSSSETDMNAVLWQDGSVVDLNDVVPGKSQLHLAIAFEADNAGDIAASACRPGSASATCKLKGTRSS